MVRLKNFVIYRWGFLILIFLFLFQCAPAEKPQPLSPRFSEKLKNIVVIPFDYHCPTETPLPFYCPVQGIIPGEIEINAKEIMNQLLRKELAQFSGKHNFIFLSQNEFETLLEEGLSVAKTSSELVRYIAEKTGAEGVLYGKIFRFKERKGASWSVEEPASVAFTLVLYDGESGRILWQGVFDETQKPLSENLLNLSLYGKVKWLTAEELAERGLKKVLRTFP
ncbi:MAG: hypothetical protein ABWJ99_00470 [Caldimicrobium sp.]